MMTDMFEDEAPFEATPTKKVNVEESVGALVANTTANPVAVFTDEQQFSEFYAKLKAATDQHVPDLTTATGRKAIASLAFRVTKAKTSLDAAGKGLTEEWRKQTALVNESRKKMTAELDQLAAEVRRPLTEWEAAEAARVERNRVRLQQIRDAGIVREDDTADSVEQRGREIWALSPSEDFYVTETEAFKAAKDATVQSLVAARDRLRREEADRAELERLRAEAAEREAAAEAERIERERGEAEAEAERQRVAAAEQAERDRIAAEEAERQRIADAERAAEQRAREAADREREAEAERVRQEHEAALAAERKAAQEREAEANARAAEAERLRQAEIDRVKEVERKREAEEAKARAEAQRMADEQAKRDADRAHRTQAKTAAKEALMALGADEKTAVAIVLALIGGDIPHASWRF